MARSLDSNIYGSDTNRQAEACAADALDPVAGAAGTDLSDYWGKTKDERAVAKGNTPELKDYEVKILRKEAAGGGDNEALNDSTKGGQRHRPGPKTSRDEGVKYPGPAGKK
jgi:hypothetical protein